MPSTKHLTVLLLLTSLTFVFHDVTIATSPNKDKAIGSSSQDGDSNIKLIDIIRKINGPCSSESLLAIQKAKIQPSLSFYIDSNFEKQKLVFKEKCLLTFVTHLFPFWSNDESRDSLVDWSDLAYIKLVKNRGAITKHDTSTIKSFQTLLDPKMFPDFEKRLRFNFSGASMSSKLVSIAKGRKAKESFTTGKHGYCWPMQSYSFVEINEIMEIFISVFHEKGKYLENPLFANPFISDSFNLYTICKNIQKNIGNQRPQNVAPEYTNLPETLQAIAQLPIVDVSTEDAEFYKGCLKSLKGSIDECEQQKLLSLTAIINEINEYTDNLKLKQYLMHKVDSAKDLIIRKCLYESQSKFEYTSLLERSDVAVSAFMNAMWRISQNLGLIDKLKSGNVGQVTHLLESKETHEIIAKLIKEETYPRMLLMLDGSVIDSATGNLAEFCPDFKEVHNDRYADSLSYLIHQFLDHKIIQQVLDEDFSISLKYLFGSLVCRSL